MQSIEQRRHDLICELIMDERLNAYYRSAEMNRSLLRDLGLAPSSLKQFSIPDLNMTLAKAVVDSYLSSNGDAAFLGEMLIAVPHDNVEKIKIKKAQIKKFMSKDASYLYNEREAAIYITGLFKEADCELARRRELQRKKRTSAK